MSTTHNANRILDGENYAQRIFPSKQLHSERKHTIRKHALGEIKNVIHNQPVTTPFKGVQNVPTKSIFSDYLKKQTEHVKTKVDDHQKCEQMQQHKFAPKIIQGMHVDDIEKRELPAPRTCNEKCHKSLEEIWSEMNVLDPDTLERLVNGDADVEDDYDIPARNLTPIHFNDEFELTFDLRDPFELERNKSIEELLANDYGCPELPPVLDWIDEL